MYQVVFSGLCHHQAAPGVKTQFVSHKVWCIHAQSHQRLYILVVCIHSLSASSRPGDDDCFKKSAGLGGRIVADSPAHPVAWRWRTSRAGSRPSLLLRYRTQLVDLATSVFEEVTRIGVELTCTS